MSEIDVDLKLMPPARQVLALILKARIDIVKLFLELAQRAHILKKAMTDGAPAPCEHQGLARAVLLLPAAEA